MKTVWVVVMAQRVHLVPMVAKNVSRLEVYHSALKNVQSQNTMTMEYACSAMKTVLEVVMVQIQQLVPVVALHVNMLMMNQNV